MVAVRALSSAIAAAILLASSSPLARAQDDSQYDNGDPSAQDESAYQQDDSAYQQDDGAYASTQGDASDMQEPASDPPSRVVRLAYQSGDVSFAAAGDEDWGSADVNRPLVTGDRLETGRGGRVALELGDASVRLNDDTAFDVLDLSDSVGQFELTQGAMNLRVRDIQQGQTYEVDTPTVAFVADQPGNVRIDVAPDGNGTMVTVFSGGGIVYGEGGVSRQVTQGRSYRFGDARLQAVTTSAIPAPDAFDDFSASRDQRFERSVSRRYVSDDVIGIDELDTYGEWSPSQEYGQVWYPTRVATNWAPYQDGHWAWIDPWGWTWVDNAPWGFAPSHYGRWAYVGHRWGWIPGERRSRSVYAPALVAFIGGNGFSLSINLGGGSPVGWFPLGPRDVYRPPYRVSRNYYTNINIFNIRIVNRGAIDRSWGDYRAHRHGRDDWGNRHVAGAVTVVPRSVFTGARPVRGATLQVSQQQLANASVDTGPRIPPTQASIGTRPGRGHAPGSKAFERPVIARRAPPARQAAFADRIRAIQKQGGEPLAPEQLRELRQQRAHDRGAQKVVLAQPGGAAPDRAPREPMQRGDRMPRGADQRPQRANDQDANAPGRPAGNVPSAGYVRGRPDRGQPAADRPVSNAGNGAAPNGNTGIVPPHLRKPPQPPRIVPPVERTEDPITPRNIPRDATPDDRAQARDRMRSQRVPGTGGDPSMGEPRALRPTRERAQNATPSQAAPAPIAAPPPRPMPSRDAARHEADMQVRMRNRQQGGDAGQPEPRGGVDPTEPRARRVPPAQVQPAPNQEPQPKSEKSEKQKRAKEKRDAADEDTQG